MERKTERSGPKVGWSGADSGAGVAKTMERSGARSGRLRSGNGAGSGGCRNRLERGAAFSPITLRSHALVCLYVFYCVVVVCSWPSVCMGVAALNHCIHAFIYWYANGYTSTV